jgi:hypothetical protein
VPETVITVRATRAEVRQAIAKLPQAARGQHGCGDLSRAMVTAIGMAALGCIRTAFVAKARGGTDEAGERWQPLSLKTIAYSRRGGRSGAERNRPNRPSQALTSKQQDRWWGVYRRSLARFKGDKSRAAKTAWFILKGEGATTLLEKYGHRQVEILRDTGLLLNSLSPGAESEEQVFRPQPGEITLGTNRVGASQHHSGVPGRLPQRRLWPKPSNWPSNWWADLTDQARDGIVEIAQFLVQRTGGGAT